MPRRGAPVRVTGHALIDLPGPVSSSGRRSDGPESFARTFLAAGFRLAQGGRYGGLAECNWYCRMTGEPDDTHRDRLRRYLTGAQHLYAPDGGPVCHHR